MPGNKGCHYCLLNGEQIILVTGWCHCKNMRIKFKLDDRLWSSRCSVCNLTLNILLFGIHFLHCFGNKSCCLSVLAHHTPIFYAPSHVMRPGGEFHRYWTRREPQRLFCATGSTIYIYTVSIVRVQNMPLLVYVGVCNLPSLGLKTPCSLEFLGFPGLIRVLK